MEESCTLSPAATACIAERQDSILTAGKSRSRIHCTTDSLAGSVSQRACVFCGARVVLNPVTDAVHLVHGPIGCATYTMDIRGSLSSGSELFRTSFCDYSLWKNHARFRRLRPRVSLSARTPS